MKALSGNSRMSLSLSVLPLLLLLVIATFLSLYNLGGGFAFSTYTGADEIRHIRAAQEMGISGNWWKPTLDGAPYLLKPPLKMWLSLLASRGLSESNFSFRVVDGILGVLLNLLLWLFALRLFKSQLTAVISVLTLLGNHSFFFSHGVRSAVQDSMMLFLTLSALLYSLDFIRVRAPQAKILDRELRKAAIVCGVLIGLGALTKSVAAFFPFLVWIGIILTSGNPLRNFKNLRGFFALTALLAISIPLLYFIPHFIFHHEELRAAFHHELVVRFGKGIHNTSDPLFYLKSLASDQMVPFFSLLFGTIFFVGQARQRKDSSYSLVLIWFLLLLIGYSCLKSRLEWYLAPAYFPMALIVGETTRRAIELAQSRIRALTQRRSYLSFLTDGRLLLSTVFTLVTVILISRSVGKVAADVLSPLPRIEADFLVESMRSTGSPVILSYQMPKPATVERIYFNIIKPHTEDIATVEALESRIAGGGVSFILTGLTGLEQIAKVLKPQQYLALAPFNEDQGYWGESRLEPLIALSLLKQPLPRFRPMSYALQVPNIEFLRFGYGWKPGRTESKKELPIIYGSGASIIIEGDALLYANGAKIELEIEPVTHTEMELNIYLNSKLIGTISPHRSRHGAISIRQHLIFDGRNVVEFVPVSLNKEALQKEAEVEMLRSLSVTPSTRRRKGKNN